MSAVRVVLYPQRSIFISQGDKSSKLAGNLKNTTPFFASLGCKNKGNLKGSSVSIPEFLKRTLSPAIPISSEPSVTFKSLMVDAFISQSFETITGASTEYALSARLVTKSVIAKPFCPPANPEERKENLVIPCSFSASSNALLNIPINTPIDDKISIGVSKNICTNIILIYKNYINKQNIIIIIKNNKRVFVDFAQTYETRGGGQGHKPSAFVLICGGLL